MRREEVTAAIRAAVRTDAAFLRASTSRNTEAFEEARKAKIAGDNAVHAAFERFDGAHQ